LIAAAAGAEREPAADAVDRLDARLGRVTFTGASLGGADISVSGESLIFGRDRGAIEGRADGAQQLPPLTLQAGVETVWDGRLLLKASALGVSVHADPPAPRLVMEGKQVPPLTVQKRWLLAERVAHALQAGDASGAGASQD
jgi:hypothetical protein